LFHGPPYTNREEKGKIDPLETAVLVPGGAAGVFTANFSTEPRDGYAFRLLNAAGKVVARSNERKQSANRDLRVVLLVLPNSEADLAAKLPVLPHTKDKTTFNKLVLDFPGNELRLFGHAFHDGIIDKHFTFDYRFDVTPVGVPVWTPVTELDEEETPADSLKIDNVRLRIDADRNRQELLMGILRHRVKKMLRRGIQRVFHEGIAKASVGMVAATLITAAVEGNEFVFTAGVVQDPS